MVAARASMSATAGGETLGDSLLAWAERSGHRRVTEPAKGGVAVCVLWAGVDGGSPGSGDVSGSAAGSSRSADGRAWADCGRVFRCGTNPGVAVGATP
jgi:hypothetical protein